MSANTRGVDVVAAFDFDGTLSTRDNFVPFLCRFAGLGATGRAFASGAVQVGRRGRSHWSRDAVKAALLHELCAGRAVDDLEATARDFAADVLAKHLRREAVELADWHRTQGHRLVIVSASLGVYLRPIAEQLRFDAVLATELEADDGSLTGNIVGDNVRGPEKARRLDLWIDDELPGTRPFVWAYGDSSGDKELWARADRSVRFGRRAHKGTG
jgi:HAD superfamily hydrolase (TIGR01490 family)